MMWLEGCCGREAEVWRKQDAGGGLNSGLFLYRTAALGHRSKSTLKRFEIFMIKGLIVKSFHLGLSDLTVEMTCDQIQLSAVLMT